MFNCEQGDLIRIKNWDTEHPDGFTNTAGVAADPTNVTLSVEKPDGTTTSYTYAAATVSKEAIGKYYKDLAPDQSGIWFWRWVGTGGVQAASQGSFFVVDKRPAS